MVKIFTMIIWLFLIILINGCSNHSGVIIRDELKPEWVLDRYPSTLEQY